MLSHFHPWVVGRLENPFTFTDLKEGMDTYNCYPYKHTNEIQVNEKYQVPRNSECAQKTGTMNEMFIFCVEKVSKLHLPTQKWTMNETLIFFEIRAVLKKYRDWSCIYQERNEQWIKRWFSWKYELCWKSIETEAIFSKTKINHARNVNFLQNTKC